MLVKSTLADLTDLTFVRSEEQSWGTVDHAIRFSYTLSALSITFFFLLHIWCTAAAHSWCTVQIKTVRSVLICNKVTVYPSERKDFFDVKEIS